MHVKHPSVADHNEQETHGKYMQNKTKYRLTKICPFPGYWMTDSSPFFTSLLFSGRTLQKTWDRKQSIVVLYYNSRSVKHACDGRSHVMQRYYVSDNRFMWLSHPKHNSHRPCGKLQNILRLQRYTFQAYNHNTVKPLCLP
jgi:hypothetical protein